MKPLHILLLVLTSLLPSMSKAQDEPSNPVYIAALLLDEPGERDMARLCTYYGFTEQAEPAAPESQAAPAAPVPSRSLSTPPATPGSDGQAASAAPSAPEPSPSGRVIDAGTHRVYGTRADLVRRTPGLREDPSTGAERVFTRPDGTELRFRVTGDRNNTDPTVEVRTNQDIRLTAEDLKQLRYEQEGKNSPVYRKGTKLGNRYSTATLTGDRTHSTVRFRKVTRR